MNPTRIFEHHREDALAKQIEATEYSTFVAMPFRDTFSYRSQEIYRDMIQKAAETANELDRAKRKFAVPKRVDDGPGQAVVITEEIVVGILEAHLFLADVTSQNAGVILETGIALGLKPNSQIILISQGRPEELHFDLRNNNVIFYRDSDSVQKLAVAMIAAASEFEKNADECVMSVVKSLTSPAIRCLHWFGEQRKTNPHQSLHEEVAHHVLPAFQKSEALLLFQAAAQELIQRKLFYMHFGRGEAPGGKNWWGMGATDLGWAVIAHLWPELRRTDKN